MKDFDNLPVLIPVPKAAAILGLSRASAYRLASDGQLPARRLGGRVFIVTAKLQEFIDGSDRDVA
jgi:excisionase family DNA binding protein